LKDLKKNIFSQKDIFKNKQFFPPAAAPPLALATRLGEGLQEDSPEMQAFKIHRDVVGRDAAQLCSILSNALNDAYAPHRNAHDFRISAERCERM